MIESRRTTSSGSKSSGVTPDDPYAILGIEPTATQEEVDRAYRRRARETHPDRGGSPTEFRAVTAAYELLSDVKRRNHYDATGETEAPHESAHMVNVMGIIAQCFDTIFNQSDDGNIPVESIRFIGAMKEGINNVIGGIKKSIQKLGRQVANLKKTRSRFKVKDGKFNTMAGMVDSLIGYRRQVLEQQQKNLEAHIAALKLLDDFDYDADPMDVWAFAKNTQYRVQNGTWVSG